MKMLEVESMLKDLRKAREAWGKGRTEFFAGYDWVLTRLIHQGVVNYMGANQIAAALGVSPKTIRAKMRQIGLDPRGGKRVLNARASEAIIENASIMGIEPEDMDLTSPLAYLPMGEQMRKAYQDKTLARVTGFPETDRDRLAAAIYGNGEEPEWLTTVDGSPNAASYELADRALAEDWM